MIYLLGGYMWLFIHRPFEVWPWLGALRVERVYMIGVILYWACAVEKTWIRNRLNTAFLLMAVAILCSNWMSPYAPFFNATVENWLKVAIFYVLVMSSVRSPQDLRRLVTMFLVVMGLYMAHSFYEFLNGRHVYRMGTARMVGVDATMNDPNTFGATLLYGLPMAWPVWLLAKKRWQKAAVAGYVILTVTCILLTGSRTALVALGLLGGAVTARSRYRVRLAFALVIVAAVAWANMPEDLRNRYLTLWDPSVGPENAAASAEGRQAGFMAGIHLWKSNPFLGVGPGAFPTARTDSRRGSQAHNLYGEVIGELGACGGLALGLICFGMLANVTLARRRYRHIPMAQRPFEYHVVTAVGTSLALLLLLGWGGHNLYRYTWMWYGAFQAIAVHYLIKDQAAKTEQHGSLGHAPT